MDGVVGVCCLKWKRVGDGSGDGEGSSGALRGDRVTGVLDNSHYRSVVGLHLNDPWHSKISITTTTTPKGQWKTEISI